MAVKIGGSEGSYTKRKNFKLKDGDNVFRILPSLGFNGKEPDGKPFKFYNVHFGYKNSEGKMRVFQSPEVKNRETRMIETSDAAKERMEKLKAELEKAKVAKNKAMVDKLSALVGGQKPMYNLDNNHHCNAINESGEIGVLKLRHKCKLALDAVIKQLRSKGVEPLSADNGRFFVINRTGSGLDTTFTVSVLTKNIEVAGLGTVQQEVVHKLTPEIVGRLEAEAADLDTLYARPTAEEVARIVSESDLMTGKSPAIDELLDRKTAASASSAEEEPESEEPETVTVAAVMTPSVTATVVNVPNTVTLSAPTAKVSTPVSELSDEEFLKSLGV